jgi:hypothetical protein
MDVSQRLTPSSVFCIFQMNQGGVLFALVMRLSKKVHFPVKHFCLGFDLLGFFLEANWKKAHDGFMSMALFG